MESSAGSSTDLASPGNAANQVSPDNAEMPAGSASPDSLTTSASSATTVGSTSPASTTGLASPASTTGLASGRVVMGGRLIAAGRWLLRRRRLTRRAARPLTAKKAGVILAVLAVLAAVFASTTAVLAHRALSSATGTGTPTATAALITPAPDQAAGLPRRYRLTTDQLALLAIAQFRARFAVLRRGSTAVYPQALYGEPGRVDLVSDSAGWVMYLGYNAPASLGDPAATASRLMTVLAGQAPAQSWQVPAGAEGGAARCMIAVFGLLKTSVCGWATGHTVAAVISPTSIAGTNELAALMSFMRLNLQPG